MANENWQQVKEIFADALRRKPEERRQFLDEVCDAEDTRREVESLLSSFDDANSFMENPAVGEVAEIIRRNKHLESGRCFGHYEIVEQIGVGGMGEVYLAKDKKLDRQVAVKILNERFGQDESNLNRFIQEAKAASALNHPNILVIHEIGADGDAHFIVSEFIEGETLREIFKKRTLKLSEVLDVSIQIAGALCTAHEARLVHRDIKPENIMLRPDSYAKILDFGLAKLVEHKSIGFENAANKQNQTAKGIILGTVNYMSPEQAKGKPVDESTDIFSFGVVIYEMLAGKTPFVGDSMSETFANLINAEPPPISHYVANVPEELQRIIDKTLRKNKDERYRTMKDLLIDLRHLKNRLEFEAEKERLTTPELFKAQPENKTQTIAANTDPNEVRKQTFSSLEYVTGEIKRHKFFAFGVPALLALVTIGFVIYKYPSFIAPVQTAATSHFTLPQNLKVTRLTSGQGPDMRISPDGRYIAYVLYPNSETRSIRLRQIATTSDVEILAPVKGLIGSLSFTPDGDYLYYNHQIDDSVSIYKVPTLGGLPSKIADKTYFGLEVSPDGKSIAFLDKDKNESSVMLANADGSDVRTLFKQTQPSSFYMSLAWSPDGKTVACVVDAEGIGETKILGVNVADGGQRQLSEQIWEGITGLVWLPDGNLIINGVEKSEVPDKTPPQLWLVAPNAAPQRITNDLNIYRSVSATAKGDVLLALAGKYFANLWIAPDNASRADAPVISLPVILMLNWTPDNNLLYASDLNGNWDIWAMNADGTNQKQLTAMQGDNFSPLITADGRNIVFISDRSGESHIYRMDADGKNPKQLTNGLREYGLRLSPDGKWIYYVQILTQTSEPSNICKMPIDGGEPVVIAKLPSLTRFDISPRDGMIAYEHRREGQKKPEREILVIPPDGGAPVKTLTLPISVPTPFRWTPDGRAIAFINTIDNRANIWAISLDGKGEAKPLTDFKFESITDFAWSADDKQLAVVNDTFITDTMLISETK